MDGTFLDSKGQFDMDRLKQVLARFKEKDMYFAVASGRGLLSLEKLFEEVRNEIIFIAENGSLVEFPYVNVNELLLTGKRACYVLETVDPTYLSFSAHYNENIQKVASLADIDDEIFKFTTNFAEDQVAAGEAWVNENIDGVKAMTTGYKSIDIVLDHVDKGVAIVELAKKLDIDLSQVMVFGDNLNDMHMMQVAGYPIATENARPEILEVAKEVIGHHDAQSVITYMEGL